MTALWVCVHPISKEKADQMLATAPTDVVPHREEMIQCIALQFFHQNVFSLIFL
jgi:hypothetical protein